MTAHPATVTAAPEVNATSALLHTSENYLIFKEFIKWMVTPFLALLVGVGGVRISHQKPDEGWRCFKTIRKDPRQFWMITNFTLDVMMHGSATQQISDIFNQATIGLNLGSKVCLYAAMTKDVVIPEIGVPLMMLCYLPFLGAAMKMVSKDVAVDALRVTAPWMSASMTIVLLAGLCMALQGLPAILKEIGKAAWHWLRRLIHVLSRA